MTTKAKATQKQSAKLTGPAKTGMKEMAKLMTAKVTTATKKGGK